MFSCRKTYSDIPFAHRQDTHDGHCALIHGHNWTFTFEFSADTLDGTGFVIDFGKLGFIRDEIARRFDHAYVYNRGDAASQGLVEAHPALFKPLEVDRCSCEGIARYLLELLDPTVRAATGGRVWISAVEVEEDSKNSASYAPGGAGATG
jgi:6-pyruvoyltetrahydropterin/6-carboxytetrahydropterin synthase